MALVRVYCGISAVVGANYVGAPARLTAAVVDDAGRLLEYCEINDDAAGYAFITGVLAEQFGATTGVMIAVDSDDHSVISLLAASGRPMAYIDDATADDFAHRYGKDESVEDPEKPECRAIGLARALHAGDISAVVVPPPREYANLKPILTAHAALASGRHAAALALREVLRELYPAALRAYPDPATPIALAMLDALPEPSLLAGAPSKSRDTAVQVAARLVSDGLCDNDTALDAFEALRMAVTESPRRNGVAKQLNAAMAESVRASVAAVRSADTAAAVLINALNDKVAPVGSGISPVAPKRKAVPTALAPPPVAPRPIAPPPVAPAPEPVDAFPIIDAPMPAAAQAEDFSLVPSAGRPAWAQSTPQPLPPGFEPTPVTGLPILPRPKPTIPAQRVPASAPPQQADQMAPFVPTLTTAAINSERAARGLNPVAAAPGDRANWPLIGEEDDDLGHYDPARPGRVPPPWQTDDLVMPPSLRLVEPAPVTATGVPPRLVDDTALTARIPKPRRTEHHPTPNGSDDTDLLIFTSVSSAWFTHDDTEATWNSAMDNNWRAAEEASLRPSIGGDTHAGLPQRVPSANLVPGSAYGNERPLRIVRDAGEIAAHTSSYFRGYRRGNQEAGGFSVGGRPGRESASGWDFSREHEFHDDRGDYSSRAANYR